MGVHTLHTSYITKKELNESLNTSDYYIPNYVANPKEFQRAITLPEKIKKAGTEYLFCLVETFSSINLSTTCQILYQNKTGEKVLFSTKKTQDLIKVVKEAYDALCGIRILLTEKI